MEVRSLKLTDLNLPPDPSDFPRWDNMICTLVASKEHGKHLVRMLDGALGRPDSFGLNALTAKEFDDPLWDDEEPESEVIYTSEADATSRSTATNASQPISASDVHRPIAPKMQYSTL